METILPLVRSWKEYILNYIQANVLLCSMSSKAKVILNVNNDHVFEMYCIFGGEPGATDGICDDCAVEQNFEQLVTHYFHHGYPYDAIVGLLKKKNIGMSVRTLKRHLRSLGLKRRCNSDRRQNNQKSN